MPVGEEPHGVSESGSRDRQAAVPRAHISVLLDGLGLVDEGEGPIIAYETSTEHL